MGATIKFEPVGVTSGLDLPAAAARFDATPEQLMQLEQKLGSALILRGVDLGYLNDRGTFEVLMAAGA